jgi:peptidoglycan L-alanyl-D-glutamate endopeptidase CwlK
MYAFGKRSLKKLEGIHPDLRRVLDRAIATTTIDFTVLEGLRTIKRQHQLYDQGATKTMNSRHLSGHAVDIAPLAGRSVSWEWPLYYKLADVVKAAAVYENVKIQWGGDWRTFKDGPHWELPWREYPL